MSQVKASNIVTSDGTKTGTVADIIDGGNKTKLFSPFSLGVLAATDGAAFRTSITAAKSGVNSDITELNGLTKQIVAQQGGVSPGYIDGLQFKSVTSNVITVTSGAAYIPFAGGGRVVTLLGGQTITLTTGTSNGRLHLWLGEESGVGKVFVTESESLDLSTGNYWGSAFKSVVVDGRRYIGSAMRNAGGDLFRFIDTGATHQFNGNSAAAPLLQVNGNTSQTVQTLQLTGIAPPTSTSVIGIWTVATGGPATRIAPSSAVCGYTISTSAYQNVITAGVSSYINQSVGDDVTIQYVTDSGTNVAQTFRVTGYNYRR